MYSSVQETEINISIHAPLAGCDQGSAQLDSPAIISIHAPLAGCDQACRAGAANPRKFQSTHPLRGATEIAAAGKPDTSISIHAPLAGCDWRAEALRCDRPNFNPRTPCGVRLPELVGLAIGGGFQSTHPLRGATPPHSPGSAAMSNFNPRTPCGVRPTISFAGKSGPYFNPRTPCGVRRRHTHLAAQL